MSDCMTLKPVMAEVRGNYGLKRLVVVADKGLNLSLIHICLLFSNGLQARIPVPIRIMSMIFIAAKGMMIPPAP